VKSYLPITFGTEITATLLLRHGLALNYSQRDLSEFASQVARSDNNLSAIELDTALEGQGTTSPIRIGNESYFIRVQGNLQGSRTRIRIGDTEDYLPAMFDSPETARGFLNYVARGAIVARRDSYTLQEVSNSATTLAGRDGILSARELRLAPVPDPPGR